MLNLVCLSAVLALCSAALLMLTHAAILVLGVRRNNPFKKRTSQ